MASDRQVTLWAIAALRQHLRPDALSVEPSAVPNVFWVTTRKPGSENEVGQRFWVQVHEAAPDGA